MDRVAIFIDGSNFYHALTKTFGKAQIKFDRLAEALTKRASDRKLLRVYYYNAVYDQVADAEQYAKQQKFFERLRRTPYLKVSVGRLERRRIGWGYLAPEAKETVEASLGHALPEYTYEEKGVDVQLAVDMVEQAVANTYDVAILISGDGDFAPAVELVKKLGKHVELGRVRDWPCNQLRDVCDIEITIDEKMLSQCWT